ncbi:MAG TPA: putative Fe-S cluster assembly protein SufT [Mariprofundaceae bacterium]|nr:putative Fe-S cluster assembly protein SufT [Mariprofundaceae bacterium]
MGVQVGETRTLLRDCEAMLVPLGTCVAIPEGSQVVIVQALGGTYTVNVNGNLVRIDNKDADALGLEVEAVDETPKTADGPVDEDDVWEAMRQCYDPEIPVNIVDLGLIYKCNIVPLEGGNRVEVVMTLTAPGCGMGPILVDDVRARLLSVRNVTEAHVELVFDPPWDRSMMSESAKLQLGMF